LRCSRQAPTGGPNPATEATMKHNADVAKTLPFKDTRDFEFAKKGLIAPLPASGVVKNAWGHAGRV
jgi:alkyl sulfatase BDS1-like metallo-beta-lactamase superfamily hydrolase